MDEFRTSVDIDRIVYASHGYLCHRTSPSHLHHDIWRSPLLVAPRRMMTAASLLHAVKLRSRSVPHYHKALKYCTQFAGTASGTKDQVYFSCFLSYPAVRLLKELRPAELQTALLFLVRKTICILLIPLSLCLAAHIHMRGHIFSASPRIIQNGTSRTFQPSGLDPIRRICVGVCPGGYSQQFCRKGWIFSLRKQVTGGKPLAHAPCFTSCYPNPPG